MDHIYTPCGLGDIFILKLILDQIDKSFHIHISDGIILKYRDNSLKLFLEQFLPILFHPSKYTISFIPDIRPFTDISSYYTRYNPKYINYYSIFPYSPSPISEPYICIHM